MDRREFITMTAFMPMMSDFIKFRKDTGTLPLQSLMIKALWELSQKAGYIMWVYFPRGHWEGEYYHTMSKLQVCAVTDKYITTQLTQDNYEISESFNWLDGNTIELDKLPEVINVWGHMWPIVELFRLEIPKFKFDIQEMIEEFIPS